MWEALQRARWPQSSERTGDRKSRVGPMAGNKGLGPETYWVRCSLRKCFASELPGHKMDNASLLPSIV